MLSSHKYGLFILLWFVSFGFALKEQQVFSDYEAPEPYKEIHGFCSNCLPNVRESPDPLVATTWNLGVDNSKLQYYRVFQPLDYQVTPTDAIRGLNSLVSSGNASSSSSPLIIHKSCSLMLDWGVERAAWLELTSPDSLIENKTDRIRVKASLSEFNLPYPGKTKQLIRYGNHTYRLETNEQYYEGVRFTWLNFDFPDEMETSIKISNISLVAKIRPTNYSGSFWSSSEELTKSWYTGAYGVRLNMEENDLNSVLVERGDRVAIQGDGHPTIAAALVAFSPYTLVAQVLNKTDSGDHHVVDEGIMAYPLFWCLSVMDYFMESGDFDMFHRLVNDIMKILNHRIDDFLAPDLDIEWFGWDDRLGNGWCFCEKGDDCPRESHLAFAGLVVRVCNDFSRILSLANMPLASEKYQKVYQSLGQRLAAVPEWPYNLGVHAAANAIITGIAKHHEIDFWMKNVLNDAVTICSSSQFNQYWILQALSKAGYMEHAIASIKLCWGTSMKLGNGCFWENSSPEWLRFMKDGDISPGMQSYCHPWASGVTAWLSQALGGIRPLLPGYEMFVASPYVSMKYPAVNSSISTPVGSFDMNTTLFRDSDDICTIHAQIKSPVQGFFGLLSHLTMPNGEPGGRLKSVLLNNRHIDVLTPNDIKVIAGSLTRPLILPEDLLFVPIQASRNFQISATYYNTPKQTQMVSPYSEKHYAASIIGIDMDSHGNGLELLGKDGYFLFGCDSGKDIIKFPSYIENVTVLQHGYPGWSLPKREFIGASSYNETYLPVDGSSQRKLGETTLDGRSQP
jgi:hypothetical protein